MTDVRGRDVGRRASTADQGRPARLTRATLAATTLPASVTPPALDPESLTVGIVHFGLGAFHRAHQAVYTEEAAAAAGESRWGILGVTGRTDTVVRQLQPQDGLYGVLTRDAHNSSLRLVGSVHDVAWPGDRSGDVVAAVAASTTHLATLTLTEQGYSLAPGGGLDHQDPGVVHDRTLISRELAGDSPGEASHTPLGLLTRGLARRYRTGALPFSVVCCDNLADNGLVVRGLVLALSDNLDAGFVSWLRTSVAFPSTMVDRITPATTPDDREAALEMLGLRDDGLVVAESFAQWVIEDSFASDRPAWELAGAILTHDVAPYETMKLRVLNTTHLLLAWTGLLCGYGTIAQAVADPRLRELARNVIDRDILPTLKAPEGIELGAYRDSVLERFANPALAHATAQVGSNGSSKLPNRVVGTIVDRLSAGVVPHELAFMLAAWIAVIAASVKPGGPELDDPVADELRARVGAPDALRNDPRPAVRRVLGFEAIFPPAIREHAGFETAVVDQCERVYALVDERNNT